MADQVPVVIVACAQCGQKMKIPAQGKGKTFKCVKCGESLHPPETHAAPPEDLDSPFEFEPSIGPASPSPPVSSPAPEIPVPSNMPDDIAVSGPRGRIGEILVQHNLITEDQLWKALEHQAKNGGRIIEILIELKHLTSEGLHTCLSKQPGIASIDLSRFRIDSKLLEVIPKELAMERCLVPIDKLGKLLTVAMACPLDTGTIQELEALTGLRVKAVLSKLNDIQEAVEKHYGQSQRDQGATDSYFSKLLAREAPAKKEEPAQPVISTETPKESPKDSAKEKPKEVAKAVVPPKIEIPLSQEILGNLKSLAADEKVSLKEILKIVQGCSALEKAVLRAADSEIYDVGGPHENLPAAIAVLDKEGVTALAENLLSHAVEF